MNTDLISRSALLAAYDAAHKGPPGGARKLIEEAPGVGGWISVKDRLPNEKDYRRCHENWDGCVIWTNGSDIGLGWYYTSTGNWSDIYDCKIDDVTHWMQIPELPKEEDDAEQ